MSAISVCHTKGWPLWERGLLYGLRECDSENGPWGWVMNREGNRRDGECCRSRIKIKRGAGGRQGKKKAKKKEKN